MKLQLSVSAFATIVEANTASNELIEQQLIDTVAFDSRKIINGKNTAFFALSGIKRNGHTYLQAAYDTGVRVFVVDEKTEFAPKDACILMVSNAMEALQQLATQHRKKFNIPLIGITGSAGKTIVKEWLYHFMSDRYKITRSPKSYNSQLGVALSLLEINENTEIAIIEAGISQVGEMEKLAEMMQPTIGVFTSFGSAHAENFHSKERHLNEKLQLFNTCDLTFFQQSIGLTTAQIAQIHGNEVQHAHYEALLALSPFHDRISVENAALTLAVAEHFGIDSTQLQEKINTLPRLAMRMETFDGIQNNLIINDTYNLDTDALQQSLEYQLSISEGKKRIAIIAIDAVSSTKRQEIEQCLAAFSLDQLYILSNGEMPPIEKIHNSIVLIKGSRSLNPQHLAGLFQLKKHKTVFELDFGAVKDNLDFYRSKIAASTKLLVMVKAASYGSGAEKMSAFLQKYGVDYLGVAYTDEGVELRKAGITCPIFVMNAEDDTYDDIIQYQLEPAIFSFEMLEEFTKKLIMLNQFNYPIHIEVDTGMRRLGFEPAQIEKVVATILAQPELRIHGIFSHLADADNFIDDAFSYEQIELFKTTSEKIIHQIPYPIIRHILNTEGIVRYPSAQFEMVRMGIGLYGFSSNPAVQPQLQAAVKWKTVVSQLKTIQAGESVSYNRRFIATKPTTIAIVPIGYADGFRRSMGYGKGEMYIHGNRCSVIGTVCMDMCMLDVTHLPVAVGDEVEIIGKHQTVEMLAKKMETIPYEVLSAISKRVHRVYIEQ